MTIPDGAANTARDPVSRSRAATWVALAVVALVLNAGWEWVQLPLYGGPSEGRPHHQLPLRILGRAAVVDAVLTVAVTALALQARNRRSWLFWLVLVGGLTVLSFSIELRAQLTDRWSYSELMPQLWIIGLSPLVQLPLLGVVSNVIVRPWRMSPRTGG